MSILEGLILFPVALICGIISVIAGGASIISYPVLVFLGLSPMTANATNAVALSFASFSAVWADRKSLPPLTPAIRRVCFVSAGAGLVGGALMLMTGEALFRVFVPGLLAFATALYTFAPMVQRRLARAGQAERYDGGLLTSFGAAALYCGYFGTGYGVILLALLRVAGVEDFVRANMLKNMIGAAVNVAVIGFFVFTPLVSWPQLIVMAMGNIVGGVAGAKLVHVLPGRAVRFAIILFGWTLTMVFAWRYWGPLVST